MFTKQELADTLRTELTQNGKHLAISQQTFANQVDNLFDLLVTDESDIADVVAKIKPMFTTLNGNYEKDNADFAKRWAEQHPEPKKEPKKEPKQKTTQEDDRFAALLEEFQSLKAELASSKAEKLISEKRSALAQAFADKGIKDEAWVSSYLKKLNVQEGTDIEAEATDALAFYNISRANVNPAPSPSGAGNGGEAKEIEAYAAEIAKSMKR